MEVGMANGRKVKKCSRIKDGNGRLVVGEDEVRRTWKNYFGVFTIPKLKSGGCCPHGGAQRRNYIGRKPAKRTE